MKVQGTEGRRKERFSLRHYFFHVHPLASLILRRSEVTRSHSLLSPSDVLVPDVIVCLNSRRKIGSQLYCLLEFEPLKCKQ